MHRNGFKSTISLYQHQEIYKYSWPHWDSNQHFNLQVFPDFLMDPVLQRNPFHFAYTGSPFTPIYSHSFFVYLCSLVHIRPSVDLAASNYICLAVACHNSHGWPDPFRHAESCPSSCRRLTDVHEAPSLIWHASCLPNVF